MPALPINPSPKAAWASMLLSSPVPDNGRPRIK